MLLSLRNLLVKMIHLPFNFSHRSMVSRFTGLNGLDLMKLEWSGSGADRNRCHKNIARIFKMKT